MRQALLGRDHRPEIRHLLARALPGAASDSIERLTDDASVTRVGPGHLIFRQGELIPVTLIIDGYAAFRRTTRDGRELVLDIATSGCLFGSAIAGQVATVDLVAITPTEVAQWSGADVRELVLSDPGMAVGVIDGMGRQVVMISQRIDGFIHQNARGRVVRVLAEYRDLFFGESPVLSRTQLPGLVGTSREMTSRVIRGLEREGMIARIGRRGLRLLSPTGLEEAADPAQRAS
jgi:CRP/FNR family transcriptional regulator, anaerobic regulatory protein